MSHFLFRQSDHRYHHIHLLRKSDVYNSFIFFSFDFPYYDLFFSIVMPYIFHAYCLHTPPIFAGSCHLIPHWFIILIKKWIVDGAVQAHSFFVIIYCQCFDSFYDFSSSPFFSQVGYKIVQITIVVPLIDSFFRSSTESASDTDWIFLLPLSDLPSLIHTSSLNHLIP